MGQPAPSLLKSALIGGAVAGVAAAVPVVGEVLCLCCCLPVVSGGFLASFLQSRESARVGARFDAGRGALVGLIAGLFCAVAYTLAQGAFRLVGLVEDEADVQQQMDAMQDAFNLPPESIEAAEKFMGIMSSWAGLFLLLVGALFVGAIFATIGGLIGGAVFKVEERPEPPIAPAAPAM